MVSVPKENSKIVSLLEKIRIVPVVSFPSVEAGLRLAEILEECGLPLVEVTFRTPCAAEAISAIKSRFQNIGVLAGTVLSPEQVDIAADAGAECIVVPGFDRELVEYAIAKGMMICPGTATPSEVLQCRSLGLRLVKFFPAELAGGVDMLKALGAVYSDMRFMPTGGVHLDNLQTYLALDSVVCCGGSWLAPERLMREGEWGQITARISAALEILGVSVR